MKGSGSAAAETLSSTAGFSQSGSAASVEEGAMPGSAASTFFNQSGISGVSADFSACGDSSGSSRDQSVDSMDLKEGIGVSGAARGSAWPASRSFNQSLESSAGMETRGGSGVIGVSVSWGAMAFSQSGDNVLACGAGTSGVDAVFSSCALWWTVLSVVPLGTGAGIGLTADILT